MTYTFKLSISYAQIAVFYSHLAQPFNDWTEAHHRQGFAWRPESVSFRTLNQAGRAMIRVEVVNSFTLKPETVRAIQVPFSVPPEFAIEIASIDGGQVVEIPAGEYSLVFETGLNDDAIMWCNLSFFRAESPQASVLKADSELDPPSQLLMTAEPA